MQLGLCNSVLFILQFTWKTIVLSVWQLNPAVFTIKSKQIKMLHSWTELSYFKYSLTWTKLLPSVVCLAYMLWKGNTDLPSSQVRLTEPQPEFSLMLWKPGIGWHKIVIHYKLLGVESQMILWMEVLVLMLYMCSLYFCSL